MHTKWAPGVRRASCHFTFIGDFKPHLKVKGLTRAERIDPAKLIHRVKGVRQILSSNCCSDPFVYHVRFQSIMKDYLPAAQENRLVLRGTLFRVVKSSGIRIVC